MTDYPFQVIDFKRGPLEDPSVLLKRPFTEQPGTFTEDAKFFVPGEELETSLNTAIAVGEPLLITGEPGTGKTQTAYFAAYNLGIGPVLHFQVKSESTAKDLLYHFDAVQYFHDANVRKSGELDKTKYVEERLLWKAIMSETPRILLIDEIDKAPRDFPNDLLHEIDKMEFTVPETGQEVSAGMEKRPIVFITSNSERRLPEPFLRRCVFHHIKFDDTIVKRAVAKRKAEYANLSKNVINTAMQRFLELRDLTLRKRPATGEFLVWLRILALKLETRPHRLDRDLSDLPYLGALLKDHQDIEDVKSGKTL